MPMIDCNCCGGLGVQQTANGFRWCPTCSGTGRVPDDFFPEDSSELRDPDEEPEEVSDGDR